VGAAIGGETMTANVGLATVLIVGAVALITIRRRVPEPQHAKRDLTRGDDEAEPAAAPVQARLAECEG
jgi:hypothetical protein